MLFKVREKLISTKLLKDISGTIAVSTIDSDIESRNR